MHFLATDDPTLHVRDLVLHKIGDTPIVTMHMVTFVVVAFVFVMAMVHAAKAIATGPDAEGNERFLTKARFGQIIETLIIALRDEMLIPVLGARDTRRYLPFLMTLFFFILFQNFFGLIPVVDVLHLFGVHETWIGGTATANLMVTGALALISFFAIEMHGFRELGVKGWFLHNFGGLVPGPIFLLPVALVVFVVELAGHLVKPTALAIRLFANMFAGHTLMAVLVSFGAGAAAGGMSVAGISAIAGASALAGVLITFLEVFVAFLQAFIFMFLTAVFISLMSHHDDEHEHEETPAPAEPAPQPA
jgi:F-type H+-transporting ATPase subunit a